MALKGPGINKLNGGLEKDPPKDRNVAGLIILGGYETVAFGFSQAYLFNSLAEAEELGLGPDTDANNAADCAALPWYHISEYFRTNPAGRLWVRNGDALTAANVFDDAGVADQLMNASSKTIRHLGIVIGGDPAASVTVTNGMQNTVTTLQVAAQTWVNTQAEHFIYIDNVVIEGKSLATGVPSLDLHTLESPQVSITVGNDLGYLAPYITVAAAFAKTAAVGTVLGSIGVRKLCECIGSVDIEEKPSNKRGLPNYSLVDTLRGRWLKPGVSSGVAVDNLTDAVITGLEAKGYIYADYYVGHEGIYFNDSQTCDALTSDFCTIENNRVWNEAARRVRRTLIPRMNSTVDISPTTGYIDASTIALWTATVKRELEALMIEREISDFSFTINPAQNVLGGAPIITRTSVTPRGIARAIENDLGFVNPFKL